MPPRLTGLLLAAALLAACADEKPQPQAPKAGAADMHNSQNSLDWSGAYEGILACEGFPGT